MWVATKDQSIYPPGKMEFPVHLAAGETQELTFLVACPGGEAPVPSRATGVPPSCSAPRATSGATGPTRSITVPVVQTPARRPTRQHNHPGCA